MVSLYLEDSYSTFLREWSVRNVSNITNMNDSDDSSSKTNESLNSMRTRFRSDNSFNNARSWESLWTDGVTPWDLGGPTPALVSEIASLSSRSSSIGTKKSVARALVPGCGAGYDLETIAGYYRDEAEKGNIKEAHVYGLDLSPTSLKRASEVLTRSIEREAGNEDKGGNIRLHLVHGDFFDSTTWLFVEGSSGLQKNHVEADDRVILESNTKKFDFILDYTFFCALPVHLREAWGKRMAELLTPTTGRLLTLMFPLADAGSDMSVGPPYPVSVSDYQDVLEPHGVYMESPPLENPDTITPRQGKEMACWWTKPKDVSPSKL